MHFEMPYFITPHAIEKFQQRVHDLPARQVMIFLQSFLQEPPKPVATFEYNRQSCKIYLALYEGKPFFIPTIPSKSEGDWPVITTILPVHRGPFPTGRKKKIRQGRWDKDEVILLEMLHQAGKTYDEIAKILGRKPKAVGAIIYRRRLVRRVEKNWTREEEQKTWAMAMDEYYSIQEIAHIQQRSYMSVNLKLHRMLQQKRAKLRPCPT